MSARIVPSKDVKFIIAALHCAAELYLRDAINMRAENGSPVLVALYLSQQDEALRIAADLEHSGVLPMFIRKQAE